MRDKADHSRTKAWLNTTRLLAALTYEDQSSGLLGWAAGLLGGDDNFRAVASASLCGATDKHVDLCSHGPPLAVDPGAEVLRSLRTIGRPNGVPNATYEQLTAFEFDAARGATESAPAWRALLSALHVPFDDAALSNFLTAGMGSAPPPAPHSASIANAEEVQQALQEHAPQFLKWFRA